MQCVVVSAGSLDQLAALLNSVQLIPRLSNQVDCCAVSHSTVTVQVMDDMDKILSNKPVRQPMVSTLQQRWAATGGMPPQ